jgi:hypothetical protein
MKEKNETIENNLEHPVLFNWKNELLDKIKNKEEVIKEIVDEMKIIEDLNEMKKNEVTSLEKVMNDTLENIEKRLDVHSKNMKDKLDKFKNQNYTDIRSKSNDLFSLHKELYKDSNLFFSKQEFKSEPTTLISKIDDTLSVIYKYMFKEENENWSDVLTPICELEYQYKDMEINYHKYSQVYNFSLEKYNDKKAVYTKEIEELNKMKKELNALEEFKKILQN